MRSMIPHFKREGRLADTISTKVRTDQRKFLEDEATATGVTLCDVVRGLIDKAMMVKEGVN